MFNPLPIIRDVFDLKWKARFETEVFFRAAAEKRNDVLQQEHLDALRRKDQE
jgi:hypothetical protein